MTDKKTERRNSVLDRLLGRIGAADEIRAQVSEAEKELDAAGIQHKALTASELEALLASAIQTVRADRVQKQATLTQDDLVDIILAMHEALADVPPENARETVVQFISDLMADDTAEIEMALFGSDEEETAEERPDEKREEEKTKTDKRLTDLLDRLVDDQADMTDALINTMEMVVELEKADLPGQMKALTATVERLAGIIEGPARRASDAAETRVPDAQALEAAIKKLQADDYTVVAGIPVRK